jgi:hypothetical protein
MKVTKLLLDNGDGFSSNRLKRFYNSKGIKLEYTCSYSQSQNGISERMNISLLNKVRLMLCETELPKLLWGECICCAAYQLSRSPTSALSGKVPASIYLGKCDLEKLHVFLSKVFAHILPKK